MGDNTVFLSYVHYSCNDRRPCNRCPLSSYLGKSFDVGEILIEYAIVIVIHHSRLTLASPVSRCRGLYMFHKPQDLLKRTPPDGINRPEFLKQLVQEFRKTNSAGIINDWRPNELRLRQTYWCIIIYLFTYLESKLQVLANLANFAYDPVNYQHIRTQKVIDLFLEQLASDNNKLIEFSAAGLCNLVNGNIY